MNTPLSNEELDRLARKRAGAKMGWYIHACVYIAVNLGLITLSHLGLRSHNWPIYPALGWGLGLALHGLSVFVLAPHSTWRERLVQRERERLQREHQR